MERSQLFDLMGELQLYGMKAAFDEIMATAVKRQHDPQRIIGDLLTAEISEKQARSIKYQLTIAKLPLAKDLDDFQFEGTPINETLVRDLIGPGTGWKGLFLGEVLGMLLPGGPYVVFPLIGILYQAGAGLGPAVALVTSWATQALLSVTFEVPFMGYRFAIVRWGLGLAFPVLAGALAQLVFGG